MGLIPVKLGQVVKPVGVERYKGVTNGKDVCCILSRDIAVSNQHYHPEMGYFYCWSGVCCEKLGRPQQRMVLPLLQYTVTKWPMEYGAPFVIKYWLLGKDLYENDVKVKDELSGGKITGMDLTITCTDEKYQKVKVETMGPARWRTKPEWADAVKKQFTDYGSLVEMSVARNLTPEQFLQLLTAEPRYKDVDGRATARSISANPRAAVEMAAPGNVAGLLDDGPSLETGPTIDVGTTLEAAPLGDEPAFDDLLGENKVP